MVGRMLCQLVLQNLCNWWLPGKTFGLVLQIMVLLAKHMQIRGLEEKQVSSGVFKTSKGLLFENTMVLKE